MNDGLKLFASAPDGEVIVSMIKHDDGVFVATDKNVYLLTEDGQMSQIINNTEDND